MHLETDIIFWRGFVICFTSHLGSQSSPWPWAMNPHGVQTEDDGSCLSAPQRASLSASQGLVRLTTDPGISVSDPEGVLGSLPRLVGVGEFGVQQDNSGGTNPGFREDLGFSLCGPGKKPASSCVKWGQHLYFTGLPVGPAGSVCK